MYVAVLLATVIAADSWIWLASAECNGRGQHHGNTSDACVCDAPYAGDECQHCASGFYGVPTGRGESMCYLSCSGESRLLHNFTSAGLGVPALWLTANQRPPLHNLPYYLWVVVPLINKLNSSSQTFESFSPQFYSSSDNGVLNFNRPTDFRISLQFRSNQTSQCFDETVLIYGGLPEFLTPLNSSLTPYLPNATVQDGSLVGAFTGAQLKDHSLSLSSSVLTVVYYSSTTPSSHLQGFNLMVNVEWLAGKNDSYSVNATSEQEAAATCDLAQTSVHHDIITNNQSVPYLSTLITSPSNQLEDNNSSSPATQRHSCPGRHHHSAVYEPYSTSLWIFGGISRSGELCDSGVAVINLSLVLAGLSNNCNDSIEVVGEGEREGLVKWLVSSGDAPGGRFSHAAALLPCEGSCSGSRMLVFGGFTSRLVTSRELWLYDGDSEQWTQLESAPVGFGLASHSATLTPDGRLFVIGGVNSALHISPTTLIYHIRNNTWEVLQIRTLGLPGVYGHSAAYDTATNSVLVYGGYAYSRPQAEVSSSIYSLDVGTLSWRRVQLAREVPSRIFHSMVVIGNLLVIHGGLLSQHNQPSLEGVCPSNDVTIIDLSAPALCGGRPAITLNVSTVSSYTDEEAGLWAHSLVTNGEDIFIVGGLTVPGLSSPSFKDHLISLLHLPSLSLTCSLTQTTTQCQGIPGCSVCVSNRDQSNDFIACYNTSNLNATLQCANSGGVLLIENNSTTVTCPRGTPLTCEDFESCSACLSTDIALELGCVWCYCEERCMPLALSSSSSTASCSCVTVNSTQPDICYLDMCTIPSCTDCRAQSDCRWLSRRISAVPSVPNRPNRVLVTNIPEWGCYSTILHRAIVNKLGTDLSINSCPSSCGVATSCTSCVALSSPTAGEQQTCVWAEYSRECLSSDLVTLTCSLGNCGPILSIMEQCPSPCGSRGTCELCLMDPGCVWLSNVANGVPRCVETRDLKSGVANQLADEVAVYLQECPLGITCHQFCHGNSERCIEEDPTNPEFVGWVSRGTSEDGVACVDCGGFSEGRRCESCLGGYFNSNPGGEDVVCRQCACNGHDIDDCDSASGLCSCQNNTRSTPCDPSSALCLTLSQQCSLCLPGYTGDPQDNGQCYRDIPTSAIANFSLPANHTTAFLFGPGSNGYFFSNVDVRATFVVVRGLIDVYISTEATDVKVNLNRDTWTHQLSFRQGVNFVTRSRSIKSVGESVSSFHGTLGDSVSVSTLTKGELSSQDGRLVRRALQLSSVSPTQDAGLYHFVVNERLSLIVPHGQEGFQSNNFFITVAARENTQFFFYYRQDLPRLNLFVFFSIFLCFFILISAIFVCAYQLLLFCLRQRRRHRARQRQKRRANRPMVKVVVYFGDKRQQKITSQKNKMISPDQEILQISVEGVSNDTGVFKSSASKVATKERNGKPLIVISKADENVEVVDTDCSCSKAAAGEIELETRKPTVQPPKDSSEGQKKRKKYQVLSTDDIKQWPVGIQPTADNAVCLSTMLIQLPVSSANRGGQLCTGTALLDYPKAALEEQNRERARRGLKFRRRNRLAPAPANSSSIATSQV